MILTRFLKHHLRNGRRFKRYLRELEQAQKYSPQELEAYQNEKLRQTIICAYHNVPFYRRVFDALKLSPNDIKSKEDLHKLPFIDKKTVKASLSDLRNKNKRLFVTKALTGGTTGTPGTFFRDLNSINFENAAVGRFFAWGGKRKGSRRATLRGEIICPIEQTEPPFWKHDPFSRELLLSSYHLNETNMPLYVKAIKNHDVFDLYAYPSTAYLLAEYCLRSHTDLKFSAVFTSSEMVFSYQRETIEKAFKCKLFDWYGQCERVSAIAQCEQGNYHVMEDYSLTELVPAEGNLLELVGTSFNNFCMPLIRYRTGDFVELAENNSCPCGRAFRVVRQISGREGDSIKTPDKRVVGILNHVPRGVNNLVELQFVQNSLDEVVLRVVCTPDFSAGDEKKLINNAREHISKNMRFVIEKVDKIGRGRNGKFIPVISKI